MCKEDFTGVISEMLKKQDKQTELLGQLVKEMVGMKTEQTKTNAQLKTLNLSVMKLAEQSENFAEHESRIVRLEKAVFKL